MARAAVELSRAQIAELADDGELLVFLEDEQGNRTMALVATFHGQAGSSGCSCDAGSGSPAGPVLCVLVIVLGLRRRRWP
jgi:MYXO-CTERM domain-containing protein